MKVIYCCSKFSPNISYKSSKPAFGPAGLVVKDSSMEIRMSMKEDLAERIDQRDTLLHYSVSVFLFKVLMEAPELCVKSVQS